ncbi:MAG: AmmeMemoRadiSam system protein B [Candidatus Pacebacteria bacterium]|nr:AmmeMemoRadiSam system protein B [Candidatus Paceibacterota bacterium]
MKYISGKFVIALVFASLILICVSFSRKDTGKGEDAQVAYLIKGNEAVIHHLSYRSNPRLYEMAYAGLEDEDPIGEKIYGGITPHHFLASGLIAKFFKKLESQKNIETVVIVGPNHFGMGFGEALTSRAFWDTPFGDLEPDTELINSLIGDSLVEVNERPFEEEHSISTSMPFIRKTFPSAKIVPIILKEDTNYDTCKKIAEKIYMESDGRTLVIASVDFSHNFPLVEAQERDKESIAVIENFDFDNLSTLEIDSPASIYLLLYFLKLNGVDELVFSERSNSALIGDSSRDDETVGYFIGHFGLSD